MKQRLGTMPHVINSSTWVRWRQVDVSKFKTTGLHSEFQAIWGNVERPWVRNKGGVGVTDYSGFDITNNPKAIET